MKAVILAAGYARRLAPQVKSTPKPLLRIGGEPLLDIILTKLRQVTDVDKVYVVTNDRYLSQFNEWKSRSPFGEFVQIISDGKRSYLERPGALWDLNFVISTEKIIEDLLVIAGDNFFRFDLLEFVRMFNNGNKPLIAVHDLGDPSKLANRYGEIGVEDRNKMVSKVNSFREKPSHPESSLASTLCYLFSPKELQLLAGYVAECGRKSHFEQREGLDNAGSFLQHLLNSDNSIYAFKFDEPWFDIGTYEQFRTLNQIELKTKLESSAAFSESVEAVILFADIIGSATISEYTSEKDYDAFICEFQELAIKVLNGNINRRSAYDNADKEFIEYSVRGDEAVLILYTKDRDRDVRTAMSVAVDLKREIFLSRFNRSRKGRLFYDVGIGIHYGSVVLKQHPSVERTPRKFNAEGYAINMAKRIESQSRTGRFSKIMLSKRMADIRPPGVFVGGLADVPLKGMYGAPQVCELQLYGGIEDPQETPSIKPADIDYYVAAYESSSYDMWLGLMIARYYYDEEDYVEAQKYYKKSIEQDKNFAPGHLYLGRSLYRQGKFIEAEPSLLEAVNLEKTSSRANSWLAVNFRRRGNFMRALECHEAAVKVGPKTQFEYNAYAYTLAEACLIGNMCSLDSFESAELYLEKATRLCAERNDKFDYALEHTRGLILMCRDYPNEAAECFRGVIRAIGENKGMRPLKRQEKLLEALYHLGLAEKRDHSFEAAQQHLTDSLKWTDVELDYYWKADAHRAIAAIKIELQKGKVSA